MRQKREKGYGRGWNTRRNENRYDYYREGHVVNRASKEMENGQEIKVDMDMTEEKIIEEEKGMKEEKEEEKERKKGKKKKEEEGKKESMRRKEMKKMKKCFKNHY